MHSTRPINCGADDQWETVFHVCTQRDRWHNTVTTKIRTMYMTNELQVILKNKQLLSLITIWFGKSIKYLLELYISHYILFLILLFSIYLIGIIFHTIHIFKLLDYQLKII